MSVTYNNSLSAISKYGSTSNTKAWIYFAITLGWSFAFWGIAVFSGLSIDAFSTKPLLFLGGISPMLTAILLTLMDKDTSRRQDFFQRIVDFRRIRVIWYLVIFLTAPLTSLLAVWTRMIITGQLYLFEGALALLAHPIGLFPLAVGHFFFGPLPEELGWRGFALDNLQSRWNAVNSSLILAVVWAAWHVPLFFIQGTYQHALRFGTAGFWLYMAGIFPDSILMTWIFNNTRRSTLSAILFHFMINFSGQFIDLTGGLAPYRLAWSVVIALLVILIFGKNLSKKPIN